MIVSNQFAINQLLQGKNKPHFCEVKKFTLLGVIHSHQRMDYNYHMLKDEAYYSKSRLGQQWTLAFYGYYETIQ